MSQDNYHPVTRRHIPGHRTPQVSKWSGVLLLRRRPTYPAQGDEAGFTYNFRVVYQ